MGPRGLAVPFPELALAVGHIGLVGELVQVRERRGCKLQATASATPLARDLLAWTEGY